MKGGTAINLFLQDLPRVSVDIDLTYLPLKPLQEALEEIHECLRLLKEEIIKQIPDAQVNEKNIEKYLTKLFVSTRDAVIKIEPNLVFRGYIYPPQALDLSPKAQEHFQAFVNINTMSAADLYGSKICAALDRQHPRDLFDVKLLMDSQGIPPEIRRAFVVYLAGHPRPMSELLSPRIVDIEQTYNNHFIGMVSDEVSLDDLRDIQRVLSELIVQELDADEKEFLLSMKRGEHDWECLVFSVRRDGSINREPSPFSDWIVLSGYRDIAGTTEVNSGNSPDSPKSRGVPEDPDIVSVITVIVARDRLVDGGSKVTPGNSPDRPKPGCSPEDTGFPDPIIIIVTWDNRIQR